MRSAIFILLRHPHDGFIIREAQSFNTLRVLPDEATYPDYLGCWRNLKSLTLEEAISIAVKGSKAGAARHNCQCGKRRKNSSSERSMCPLVLVAIRDSHVFPSVDVEQRREYV